MLTVAPACNSHTADRNDTPLLGLFASRYGRPACASTLPRTCSHLNRQDGSRRDVDGLILPLGAPLGSVDPNRGGVVRIVDDDDDSRSLDRDRYAAHRCSEWLSDERFPHTCEVRFAPA